MNQLFAVERPRGREYSAEFKTSVLEQCRQPGASLAGVALRHSMNPNMVHRLMREDRQRRELIKLQSGTLAFVTLQLPPLLSPSPAVGSSLAKCEQPSGEQAALIQGVRIASVDQRSSQDFVGLSPAAAAELAARVLAHVGE